MLNLLINLFFKINFLPEDYGQECFFMRLISVPNLAKTSFMGWSLCWFQQKGVNSSSSHMNLNPSYLTLQITYPHNIGKVLYTNIVTRWLSIDLINTRMNLWNSDRFLFSTTSSLPLVCKKKFILGNLVKHLWDLASKICKSVHTNRDGIKWVLSFQ
jgi:hypothetical protein